MKQWYIIFNGQSVGPMSKEQLKSYDINPQSKVWCEGMSQWAEAFTVPELMQMINNQTYPQSEQPQRPYQQQPYQQPQQPYQQQPQQPYQQPYQQQQQQPYQQQQQPYQQPYQQPFQQNPQGQMEKSNVIAGILALLLSSFGAQYFYMGKNQGGIISICICWIPWLLVIMSGGALFFLKYIPFLFGIVMFIQAIEMFCLTPADFYKKFVNNPSPMPLF